MDPIFFDVDDACKLWRFVSTLGFRVMGEQSRVWNCSKSKPRPCNMKGSIIVV